MEKPRNVYEHLRQVQSRLDMYLGRRSIHLLEHYLHGYGAALHVHRLTEDRVPSFGQFLSWLELTQGGTWKYGWAQGLLARSNVDEEGALERFFALAAEFGALRVTEGTVYSLAPGHQRSAAHRRANGDRPVPQRLQLMYLRPGEWAYLRSWYGDEPEDRRMIHQSAAEVLRMVEWEYGIPPDAWGLADERLMPRPDGAADNETA
jgi:hypothetical protein